MNRGGHTSVVVSAPELPATATTELAGAASGRLIAAATTSNAAAAATELHRPRRRGRVRGGYIGVDCEGRRGWGGAGRGREGHGGVERTREVLSMPSISALGSSTGHS